MKQHSELNPLNGKLLINEVVKSGKNHRAYALN